VIVGLLGLLTLPGQPVWAMPVRGPRQPPAAVLPEAGRATDVLVIKLREGAGLELTGDRLTAGDQLPDAASLTELLAGSGPLFHRDPTRLRRERALVDPEGRLADLTLYRRLEGDGVLDRARELRTHPLVENVYLAPLPAPPPEDTPPETPDFTGEQAYLDAAPGGFGIGLSETWPAVDGRHVRIADVEYSWSKSHEDLLGIETEVVYGWDSDNYAFHGNSVLGQLGAADNGYGVVGMVPGAELVVASPYTEDFEYNPAAAIDGAAAVLEAGDVLLIELQAYVLGTYGPVEEDPAVFDTISLAVARGIVVVEPSGNGALDLDDPELEGWFDRDLQDSGAIMVGGGASPLSGLEPRSWYLNGSSHGSRIDVQGWYDSIATTTDSSDSTTWADLFLGGGDPAQAYTESFGGTSGAAPMVAAVAAAANSVAIELWGHPWDPWDLRAAMVSTGTPQAPDDQVHIGPQPDLRRLLWTWMAR